MKLIVGIDFGTSTTVVRYKREGTNDILPVKDANGINDFIPSAIFRSSEGRPTEYGHDAMLCYRNGISGELITNFKMGLISADENHRKHQESLVEEFLSFVYKRFDQETKGLDVSSIDVYVSYPAKWSDQSVAFMIQAVGNAGFGKRDIEGNISYDNIHGVVEPRAATLNMLRMHLNDFRKNGALTIQNPMHVFMLDMGAGTTDIVIFKLTLDGEGRVEIDNLISYPPVDHCSLCGGREIDVALSNYVNEFVRKKTGVNDLPEKFFTVESAKFWKDQVVAHTLKRDQIVQIPPELQQVVRLMPHGQDVLKSFLLSKSTFEGITESHWKNLYELVTSAIEVYNSKYSIGAEDIDLLYLTGGHSQWYTVNNLFNGEGVCGYIGKDYNIGSSIHRALNFRKLKEESWRMFEDSLPHECVAKGLCLQDSDIKIISAATNNMWIKFNIGGQETDIEQFVTSGETLPITFKTSPRVTLHRGAFEKLIFKVDIEFYVGSEFSNAKKSTLCQVVDNEEGRIFAVIVWPLSILTGFRTTIEIPLTITVNDDNTIDLDGRYLYGDGIDRPTEKLKTLCTKDGKEVIISKSDLKYN